MHACHSHKWRFMHMLPWPHSKLATAQYGAGDWGLGTPDLSKLSLSRFRLFRFRLWESAFFLSLCYYKHKHPGEFLTISCISFTRLQQVADFVYDSYVSKLFNDHFRAFLICNRHFFLQSLCWNSTSFSHLRQSSKDNFDGPLWGLLTILANIIESILLL